MSQSRATTRPRLKRLNLRPLLVAAVGMLAGLFCYAALVFGEGGPAGIVFFVLFLLLLLPPFSLHRTAIALGIFFLFALIGAGGMYLADKSFAAGRAEGEYTVSGTVESAAVKNGYSSVTLSGLYFDGEREAGKMELTLPGEEVRAGDVIVFTATVGRNAFPAGGDSYALNDFASGIRYAASPAEYLVTGKTWNVFLLLNGALYDSLQANMEQDTANFAYALLTGNMRVLDSDFAAETRTGGIAHVFAVSGLHIGMLYAAVTLLLRRRCGRWAAIPAVLLAAMYCAMCAFTASSVRSLLMCAFAGGARFFGKKYDALSSLSLAAVLTLFFSPAQYCSVSFRLSYGAVAGMCIFSEPLSRGLRRIRIPSALAATLVSGVASQLVTFPLMVQTFGYVSVWGTLLNLLVIPVLPALFLPLVACAFASLVLPFASGVLLALPQGLLSAVLFLFSAADFSFVLAGFSLGAGVGVWLALNLPLCAKVRLRAWVRTAACSAVALLFALCVFAENATFSGCRIDVSGTERGTCALIRTRESAVLLIDGEVSLSSCEDFLLRTYAGELDAVCLVTEDAARAVNAAAFLPAACIYTAYPLETGLRETDVRGMRAFTVGELSFFYEDADSLTLSAQGCVAEFSFGGGETVFADLFVGAGGGRLKYLLKDGIIRSL